MQIRIRSPKFAVLRRSRRQRRVPPVRMSQEREKLVMRRPDDLHLHVRDGNMMQFVVPFSSKVFGRCTIMPNTIPPITTIDMADAYRERIQKASMESSFSPLMTLYLTDNTTEETVHLAKESKHVVAFKLYPAGATTNSQNGVTDIWKLLPVFKAMAMDRIPLLVHGEVTDPEVDVFDKEKEFIHRIMVDPAERGTAKGDVRFSVVPDLKVVMEHITTQDAVEFVKSAAPNVAASITPQHITMNRNDLFKAWFSTRCHVLRQVAPGWTETTPLLPASPQARRASAVLNAAVSGNPKFFLGTDSAPHAVHMKESSCGCAGIFSAPVAMSVYAEVFAEAGALDNLEAFCSVHGALFYGLPLSEESIELIREDWIVPETFSSPQEVHLVPFRAGETLKWRVNLQRDK